MNDTRSERDVGKTFSEGQCRSELVRWKRARLARLHGSVWRMPKAIGKVRPRKEQACPQRTHASRKYDPRLAKGSTRFLTHIGPHPHQRHQNHCRRIDQKSTVSIFYFPRAVFAGRRKGVVCSKPLPICGPCMEEPSMTAFNPMDPVHAAAKSFRDAVNAMYDARFGLQPDQFDRQALRLKKLAIGRMREELAQGHVTTDKVHSAAYQLVRHDVGDDTNARRELENALIGAVELAMIDGGMKTR